MDREQCFIATNRCPLCWSNWDSDRCSFDTRCTRFDSASNLGPTRKTWFLPRQNLVTLNGPGFALLFSVEHEQSRQLSNRARLLANAKSHTTRTYQSLPLRRSKAGLSLFPGREVGAYAARITSSPTSVEHQVPFQNSSCRTTAARLLERENDNPVHRYCFANTGRSIDRGLAPPPNEYFGESACQS